MDTDLDALRSVWRELKSEVDAIALERENALSLFEDAPQPWLFTDRDGIILEANRAARALLAGRWASLLGKPLACFVDPAWRYDFRCHLSDHLRSQMPACWHCQLKAGRQGSSFGASLTVSRQPGASTVKLSWVLDPDA